MTRIRPTRLAGRHRIRRAEQLDAPETIRDWYGRPLVQPASRSVRASRVDDALRPPAPPAPVRNGGIGNASRPDPDVVLAWMDQQGIEATVWQRAVLRAALAGNQAEMLSLRKPRRG